MEYITITPTTVVPVTQEVKYLTVTYLVNEDNLTIPIVTNPSGIRSIIICSITHQGQRVVQK